MAKLSAAQQAMIDRLAIAGTAGERTFTTGNRESARIASAWYRTARSLVDKKLITMRRSGDAYKAFLIEFSPKD